MYIITITVNPEVTEAQQQEMFPVHTEWFKKHFQAGNFVLLGPCTDTDRHEGVILANVPNREALQQILAEDCYYPDFAQYHIREFAPKMVAQNLADVLA